VRSETVVITAKSLAFLFAAGKITALMPKMKTKSGAKKRFRTTGTGKIRRGAKGRRHILTKRTRKSKRQLRGGRLVHKADEDNIKLLIPYA
jgi:large subunit ribosomal protein L35